MDEFKKYHPIVNFTYFIFVIGFSCFFMHPLCLVISLISGFAYSVALKGKKQTKTNLIYMLPMIFLMALINPLFNHEGVTILTYFPSGNPLTLESLIYGFCAGVMIVSVICHFSCYNEVMTSDKFIYLFGKIIPSISLIISMTLRFVPKFSSQLKAVANAEKCMGRGVSNGNIIKRAKCGLTILSIMTTWSLENAIDTADSMKARGYGLKGRTSFSIFKFDKRDKKALFWMLFLVIFILWANFTGTMHFSYFPFVSESDISLFSVSVFIAYSIFCIYPLIIELWEVRRWKLLRSKI